MSRFVIRNAAGAFYDRNHVDETVPVPRKDDPKVNDLVQKFTPRFLAGDVSQALKFGKEADARAAAVHPDLTDPKAFEGCTVCKTEFDTDDMSAVSDVGPVVAAAAVAPAV